MKKKIVIVISDDVFIRNYLSTNVFSQIEKKYQINYLINSSSVSNLSYFRKKKIKPIKYEFFKKEQKKYNNFHLYNTFLNQKNSKSIRFSVERILKHKLFYSESFYKNLFNFPFRVLSKLKKNIIYYFVIIFFKKNLYLKSPINSKLFKIFKKLNPDLVIIPTLGQELSFYDSVRAARELKIKSLAIIDNWDNMSSRTHPYPRADIYAVWGQQSKLHANKIQLINKKKLNIIGSARYDNYFYLRKKRIKNFFNFKYVLLFEAFGVEDNLEKIMAELDYIISANKIKNFKVIFRPHPWRKNMKKIDLDKFENIILDPQFKRNFFNLNSNTTFQPDLKYYPNLIKNAEFIISAPTTMLIESLIFQKKIILLSHGKDYFLGHYNHVVRLAHLDGIKKFKNIFVFEDGKNLGKIFKKLFFEKKNYNTQELNRIDNQRNYFLYKNSYKFGQNLENLINKSIN